MLSQVLQDSLNEQIKNEFYSAHVYLSMSSWFEDKGLPGFAKWMRVQYGEELEHGLKIFDFINDRDGRAHVLGFDAPPSDWKSPLDVFESSYAHEQKVTAMINALYAQAQKEPDYATLVLMQWFISEQVEEEKSAKLIVDQLKLAGDSGSAILILDRELGARKGGGEGEGEGGGEAT
jgi:ferritin